LARRISVISCDVVVNNKLSYKFRAVQRNFYFHVHFALSGRTMRVGLLRQSVILSVYFHKTGSKCHSQMEGKAENLSCIGI